MQTGSHGVVVNRGRIEAAQISLQAADGNVYALAGRGERVRATGTAKRDGHIWLVADRGRVAQGGTTSAKNVDGSGGTVDSEAANLAFTALTTGDLVGTNDVGGKIIQSFATGEADAAANVGAGGLVDTNAGLITQSSATGRVFFSPFHCGQAANGCVSNGGGLVENNTGTIEQSFATGTIVSDPLISPPAGIVDSNHGVTAADVFWNKQTTGATVGVVSGTQVPAANGLTTAQMRQRASFGATYDFGPSGVRVMPVGATHPVSRWQLEQ